MKKQPKPVRRVRSRKAAAVPEQPAIDTAGAQSIPPSDVNAELRATVGELLALSAQTRVTGLFVVVTAADRPSGRALHLLPGSNAGGDLLLHAEFLRDGLKALLLAPSADVVGVTGQASAERPVASS